jgi:hypothetical protein
VLSNESHAIHIVQVGLMDAPSLAAHQVLNNKPQTIHMIQVLAKLGFVRQMPQFVNNRKPASPAYRLIFAREIVCPLTGKLRGTYGDCDGAVWDIMKLEIVF